MDAAQNAKGAAADAAAAGVESLSNYNEQDYEKAVDLLTESLRNQFSNLTLCRRAEYLLRMNPPRPNACVNDCTAVLSRNADSAKALKIRGKAYAYVYTFLCFIVHHFQNDEQMDGSCPGFASCLWN